MGACVLARTLSLPFCMHSFVLGRLSDVHRFRRQALLVHHSLQTTCCASSAGPFFTESYLFKPLGRSSQASMALSSSVEPPSQHKSSFVKVNCPKINFCSSCGGTTEERIPDGEERPRAVCTVCGVVHYQNPKMVVGCLVTYDNKILLCKRKIEPCSGLWTLPAGFMELGESAVEGAVRETWEEANAEVDVEAPFAQLDIPVIGQSYIIFRAKLRTPHFSPGSETLECALFDINEIPFDQIAFSSTTVVLKLYMEDLRMGKFKVHHGVIEKRPGSSAFSGYAVRDHIYN